MTYGYHDMIINEHRKQLSIAGSLKFSKMDYWYKSGTASFTGGPERGAKIFAECIIIHINLAYEPCNKCIYDRTVFRENRVESS